MKKNKKAQLSMFIIIALIIVIILALVFLFINRPGINLRPSEDPNSYMQKCIQDSLTKTEKQIIEGNFYLNITNNFMIYYGKRVPYLCRSSQFYSRCVNQEPMLIENVRKDIEQQAQKDSDGCFSKLIGDYLRRGYTTEQDKSSVQAKFTNNKIVIDIQKKISLKKDAEVQSYSFFSVEINSPLLSLMQTAGFIVGFESVYCEFNEANWERNYPAIKIKSFGTSDQTKIYTLTDEATNKSASFAIRGCILPAGI